ncbi:MAG: hypothetical protein AAF418_03040 [Pseudomonadota bacterium]
MNKKGTMMQVLQMAGTMLAGLIVMAPIASADSLEEGIEAYNNQDFAEARQIFRQVASEGNGEAIEAQWYLGHIYYGGMGLPADRLAGYMWYNVAVFNYNNLPDVELVTIEYHDLFNARANAAIKAHPVDLQEFSGLDSRSFPSLGGPLSPAEIRYAKSLSTECYLTNYEDCSD